MTRRTLRRAILPFALLLLVAGPSSAQRVEDTQDTTDAQPPAAPNPFTQAAPAEVEASLSQALSEPSASFCKAQEAAAVADPSLCSVSQLEARQRCPALARACRASAANTHADWDFSRGAFRGIGDLIFWLVMAALLAAVALALRKILGGARLTPREAQAGTTLASAAANGPRQVGETDVARLWARAAESASASRFDDAVTAIQAALIHALRISGKLHVSPAETNGDYLRALRPEPALHGTAREVFRAVESVQFGGVAANANLYRQLFERVQPIVTRALAAALLLVLGFSQSGCSKQLGLDANEQAHDFGVLTRLLSDQHTTVRRRIPTLNVIEPEVTEILVVGDEPDQISSSVLEWVSQGGTLIVTGPSPELSTATGVHYDSRDYSGRLELAPDFKPTELALSAVAEHALSLPVPSPPGSQTYASLDGRPYVATLPHGSGQVLFVGDSAFFENASLSVGDNAFFSVSLLRRPGQVLELVGPWTGGGADSPVLALTHAGLGLLLAQLCVLGLLFGWNGGAAFGTRRDPIAERRRAFRDHVLALGANYRRARATRFALATYGAWLIERLRDRLSPQQPIGLIELAGRVATRLPEPETELVSLFVETRQAQEDLETARPSPVDLATLNKLETLAVRVGGSK